MIRELQSKVDLIEGSMQERHMGGDDEGNIWFETRAKEVATKSLAHVKEGKRLEKSLEEALNSVKGLMEEASFLKDEIIVTSDQYFKRAREHISFLFSNLQLSWMDLFQVVRDEQLVDDE